jgi:hypothetical protein
VSYESAPERDYAPPAPRAEPVDAEPPRSAPREDWAPPERSFDDAPRDAGPSESSADVSSSESAPVPSDERQAS